MQFDGVTSADAVSCSINEGYVSMTDCQDLAGEFGGLRWNLTLLKFGRLEPCQWGPHPDSHPHKLMITYSMPVGP